MPWAPWSWSVIGARRPCNGTQIAPSISVSAKFEDTLSDSRVDAVVIATPAITHHPLAKAALRAGKDVFVEKPLCLDESEGEQLVQLADKLGKVLMVGHLLQYHPCVRALGIAGGVRRIGEASIHRLQQVELQILREENALWSFAPHDISVILADQSEPPKQVRCMGGDYLNQGVADTTLTAIRFQNGVRAHVFVKLAQSLQRTEVDGGRLLRSGGLR